MAAVEPRPLSPMSKLLIDDRHNPFPTGRKLPGTLVKFTLNTSTTQDFTPTLTAKTLFEVRTTADIKCCTHDATYTFVKANEPIMWASEIDLIELGPAGVHPAQTFTMVGDTASAVVYITQLA